MTSVGRKSFVVFRLKSHLAILSKENRFWATNRLCKELEIDYVKNIPFYARNQGKLEKNPRIGMMYRTWDKMTNQQAVFQQADYYLENLDSL